MEPDEDYHLFDNNQQAFTIQFSKFIQKKGTNRTQIHIVMFAQT